MALEAPADTIQTHFEYLAWAALCAEAWAANKTQTPPAVDKDIPTENGRVLRERGAGASLLSD